jgi:hypothetical protein
MKAREITTWAALALLAWRVLHLEAWLACAEARADHVGAASICQTVNVTLCRCLPSSRGFPVSGSTRRE